MTHSFDTSIAEKVGLNAAVIFYNIQFWIEKNKANEKHFYDGNYWTYNSVKAFSDLFPYLTEKQIRAALLKLETDGYLETGNFNKSSYDRTKWYSIPSSKRSDCILPVGQMEEPKKANGNDHKGEPIPDSKPFNKPNDLKNKKPFSEDYKELPGIRNKSAIEFVRIVNQITLTEKQVNDIWEVFKIQNLTGDKFYQNESDVYAHFLNWIKTQNFKKNTESSQSSMSINERIKASFKSYSANG